ncbi:MAG: enoyl-ACP reductase [Ktedonobacteraceae bacterium]|nr:enoyl-ACP reductase [Ktedonobacteraceae bacterium]
MPLLEGKTALIFGVANDRSLAWAIAQALAREGARIVIAYQERMERLVRRLATEIPDTLLVRCDVQDDQQLDAVFAEVAAVFDGGLDILIHSVAFAPKQELENRFWQTTREGFQTTMDISAYSLVAMARRALPLMQARGGGSILTSTYMASERVISEYKVMAIAKSALECSVRYLAGELGEYNIRVNAVSPGPVNTLAARGVSGFIDFLDDFNKKAPLHRIVEQSQVGDAALFLCSPLANAITGEILHVDSGYNIMDTFA